ncbi:G-protein coupled receptor Mth2-like isoform X2 [Planococcus citri]|uniref:G-protein coupled receptor Mth2-like isoform X2 n=1 Tax=Planococcus citri TaxID=170843 RepID=UPI0031F8D7AF
MTALLSIWLFVAVIVRATESSNICCERNALISSNLKCQNGSKLTFTCNDGDSWLLDRNLPDQEFFINTTTEYLSYNDVEIEPARYCINLMEVDPEEPQHEIAIVCIEKESPEEDDTPNIAPIIIFAILEIATVVFLLIVIFVYLALPELRDLQGKCILHFLINYTVLFIITDTLHYHYSLSCVIKAYSFYFFSLCAWCWLCVSSFNIWKASIVKNLEDSRTYCMFLLYGYGIPVMMLFLMLLIQILPGNHLKPNFNNSNCWFTDYMTRWWYYHVPIAVLLLGTFFFFIDTSRRLRVTHHTRINIHRKKALKTRCCLYLKLSIIVGLTWILEILCNEVFPSFKALILITDILNCLQGFLIFITLIATRNKVLKAIAKRKPCGLNCFPNSWVTAIDMENEEENRNRYHHISITETEFIEIPMKTLNSTI